VVALWCYLNGVLHFLLRFELNSHLLSNSLSISSGAQYHTLPCTNISHPQVFFFPATPPIKLKLGLQRGRTQETTNSNPPRPIKLSSQSTGVKLCCACYQPLHLPHGFWSCISRGLMSHHVNEVLHLKGPYIAPCVYCFTSQGALRITVYIRFLIWRGPHTAPCAWGFSSQRGLILHKVSHLKENYISWGPYIAPCA
jgi:hypothetical protein